MPCGLGVVYIVYTSCELEVKLVEDELEGDFLGVVGVLKSGGRMDSIWSRNEMMCMS